MPNYTALFFVLTILAAVLGFGGLLGGAASIAKLLFVLFLILFLASQWLLGKRA